MTAGDVEEEVKFLLEDLPILSFFITPLFQVKFSRAVQATRIFFSMDLSVMMTGGLN